MQWLAFPEQFIVQQNDERVYPFSSCWLLKIDNWTKHQRHIANLLLIWSGSGSVFDFILFDLTLWYLSYLLRVHISISLVYFVYFSFLLHHLTVISLFPLFCSSSLPLYLYLSLSLKKKKTIQVRLQRWIWKLIWNPCWRKSHHSWTASWRRYVYFAVDVFVGLFPILWLFSIFNISSFKICISFFLLSSFLFFI